MRRLSSFLMLSVIIWVLLPAVISGDHTSSDAFANCTAMTPDNDTCASQFGALCNDYTTLHESYNECGCGVDPCADIVAVGYSYPLHVGAVFIILVASLLGALIPIVSKYVNHSRGGGGISPFVVCVGKCVGIGVVLACALVHMLQPSNESLTSPCVPQAFNEGYEAYAFLFCMLAGLLMQFMDYLVMQYLMYIQPSKDGSGKLSDRTNSEESFSAVVVKNFGATDNNKTQLKDSDASYAEKGGEVSGVIHTNHVHTGGALLLDVGVQKTISAYLLEFGVSVHSVFIGLTIGVADDDTVKALLVALVFHQFFEGVALGSRIADATLLSRFTEFFLTGIFAVAAPVGIAIGIGVIQTLNANGSSFLLVQGIFDGVCAGILLYIGYNLLLKDFPEDMERFCAGKKHGKKMRAIMFFALWLGAGLMAFIGKYL